MPETTPATTPETSVPPKQLMVPRRSVWSGLRPVGRWASIIALATLYGFPLYWTVTMSFKPPDEWNPPGKIYWWPVQWTLDNYKQILGIPIGEWRPR